MWRGPQSSGGDVVYSSYKELELDFAAKKLHPMDLKNAVSKSIFSIMEPIGKKFSARKAEMQELFKQ